MIPTRRERLAEIVARDGDVCFLQMRGCQKKPLSYAESTIDHFIPLSKGGTWEIENLRLACRSCNIRKGSIMPNEDGTIPEKEPRTARTKAVKRSERPDICESCINGRMLSEGEVCMVCESLPGPKPFPAYLQRASADCDHSITHCWACIIGVIPRSHVVRTMVGMTDE